MGTAAGSTPDGGNAVSFTSSSSTSSTPALGDLDWPGAPAPGAPGSDVYEFLSQWPIELLEALVAGVPVRSADWEPPDEPGRASDGARSSGFAGDSWLDRLESPHLGPVAWLGELAPSGRLLTELEALPAEVVEDDYDAVEVVAHWNRLEAYCAAQKRLAAARLARREAMAAGLAMLPQLRRERGGVRVADVNIAGDELALRLGTSRRTAKRLIASGRAMTWAGLPTADAFLAGDIDAAKADTILDVIGDLAAETAIEVQQRVLERAPHQSPSLMRRSLAKACAQVDPDQFEERCQVAAAGRRVDPPRPLPHGMASLYAVMPAVEATTVYRALDAAARSAKAGGDSRTLEQLRADALALLGATALGTGQIGPCDHHSAASRSASGRGDSLGPPEPVTLGDSVHPPRPSPSGVSVHPPRPSPLGNSDATEARGHRQDVPEGAAGGDRLGESSAPDANRLVESADDGASRSPDVDPYGSGTPVLPRMRVGVIGGRAAHVRVTVPLSTLMGCAGGPGADVPEVFTPGELDGYGPIPAGVARAVAAGNTWKRLVIDPVDDSVLELSAKTYEPPQAMADAVRATHRECVAPSCAASSDGCDLNHRIPFPVGATSVANLDPACRRDHMLVTHGGWSYIAEPDHTRHWATATGHTYTDRRNGPLVMTGPRRTSPPAPPFDGPPPF